MQLSRQVLPDLPDSVLWKLARLLPVHKTNDTAHRTFCLLGCSWRDAYCSSRHAMTLHLGPSGLRGIVGRVLAGSGSIVTRLEVHIERQAQAQLPSLVAALCSLPKLQELIFDGLGTEDMVALAPALGALGGLRELSLLNDGTRTAGATAALARALRHLTSLQHLHLSCSRLVETGVVASAIQHLTGLLSLDLGDIYMRPKEVALTIQPLTSLQKLALYVKRMGAEDTAAMARALMQLGGLQELKLSGCCMINGIGPLAPAIGGLTALRQLRFTGDVIEFRGLDAEDVEALAHALARRTGLQLLHLNHHNLGQQGAEVVDALASALQQLTGLTELDLNECCLDAEATATLAPALGCLTGLVSLSIGIDRVSEEEPGTEAAEALAAALADLTHLTRLHLHGDYLSANSADEAEDMGMAALAAAIGGLARLLHLGINLGIYDYAWVVHGGRAAAALAPTIQRLTQLQLLDLSFCRLYPEGVAALAPALQQLTGLRHLDLSKNHVEAGGAAALAQVLPQMTGLQHLNLYKNSLGVGGVEVLAPALALMPGLQHLKLSDNYMGVAGAEVLAPALALMPGLQYLAMSAHSLGAQGVMVLVPTLAEMPGLTHLDLQSDDDMCWQDVAALTRVLKQLTRLRHISLDYDMSLTPYWSA